MYPARQETYINQIKVATNRSANIAPCKKLVTSIKTGQNIFWSFKVWVCNQFGPRRSNLVNLAPEVCICCQYSPSLQNG
jgi:hypothetical protein